MRLAVVFGGRSGEHEVSVVSARSVASALDRERFEVVPMAIDRDGGWASAEEARRVLEGSGDRIDRVLQFSGSQAVDSRLLDGSIDAVFPVLHGPFGEDGAIQGMLEMLDLPYVGCDVVASAVCMDKVVCKRVLEQAGLATAAWREVMATGWAEDPQAVADGCAELGAEVFIKPARLGSSVGITAARSRTELCAGLDEALRYGARAIVERRVTGRELEVAVLGNDRPVASCPGEIVPGHDFYDYADKYLDDQCQLKAPAPLEPDIARRAQELAVETYRVLQCSGMARVDLFLESCTGMLLVNEVNTIPGFTSISMYPRLWQVSGVSYADLLERLVDLALERAGRS
jgi:D-alanine-D-alanine ligase